MSSECALSRRKALSLLGGTTGALVVTASAAQRSSDQSEASGKSIASKRPQYIPGYGSLIERESRVATWPSAEFVSPVIANGVARGWFDRTEVPSWSPTYLGAITQEGAECNGVIFRVMAAEFESYAQRELGYRPTKMDRSQLPMLDGSSTVPDGDIWYFANVRKHLPSVVHPIVQSYVDVCIDGCLEIEAMYPLAKQVRFAESFIRTTTDWGPPWVNDRIYPWRPIVHVPRAWEIDGLIRNILGQDMFDKIILK